MHVTLLGFIHFNAALNTGEDPLCEAFIQLLLDETLVNFRCVLLLLLYWYTSLITIIQGFISMELVYYMECLWSFCFQDFESWKYFQSCVIIFNTRTSFAELIVHFLASGWELILMELISSQVRDYIHVIDLADGHIAALHKLDDPKIGMC